MFGLLQNSRVLETNADRLVLINTPVYSPQLNPQENIWNLLKNKVFTIGAKDSIDSLFDEVDHLYNQFNDDFSRKFTGFIYPSLNFP